MTTDAERDGQGASPSNEQERRERATSFVPPHLPPEHLRDPGDAMVYSPDGKVKYWGRFGAAGLLVWHRESGILLQHRAEWSHNGGTWALPGGARRQGESAHDAALREADEEAGVPAEILTPLFESVFDAGFWTYTTVAVEAREFFTPVVADLESIELRWVPLDEVESLKLHPGFAGSWPSLRERLK